MDEIVQAVNATNYEQLGFQTLEDYIAAIVASFRGNNLEESKRLLKPLNEEQWDVLLDFINEDPEADKLKQVLNSIDLEAGLADNEDTVDDLDDLIQQQLHNASINLVAKVVEEDGKWYVKSENGDKNLGGPYSSKEQAEKRLGQVEFFKHKKSNDTRTFFEIKGDKGDIFESSIVYWDEELPGFSYFDSTKYTNESEAQDVAKELEGKFPNILNIRVEQVDQLV